MPTIPSTSVSGNTASGPVGAWSVNGDSNIRFGPTTPFAVSSSTMRPTAIA
jgi:hypothetical protein